MTIKHMSETSKPLSGTLNYISTRKGKLDLDKVEGILGKFAEVSFQNNGQVIAPRLPSETVDALKREGFNVRKDVAFFC